jgi:hypothetical protein
VRFFCFGRAEKVEDHYQHLFGCESGSLPLRYLRIPVHYRTLTNGWEAVEDRFKKKLANWVGRLLSYVDRLDLINYIQTSRPMFMLSFFEMPKGLMKRLDFFAPDCFWQSDGHIKKV